MTAEGIEVPPSAEANTDVEAVADAGSIKDQEIKGKVRDTDFSLDQARIQNGVLKLRQGTDFFADVSVELFLFSNGKLSGRTFSSSDPAAFSRPHVGLGVKREGDSIPDQLNLTSGFELELRFGQAESLGLPFSIRLTSADNGTNIEGKSFATYGDIKVTNGVIDTSFDSLDTLKHLASTYLDTNEEFELGQHFGITLTAYGKDYPKSGFVGYEVTTKSNGQSVAKIQLAKDENGWRVANQLGLNEVHQAHPVFEMIEGNPRTIQEREATKIAAQELERFLSKQGSASSIRSTRVRCRLTKTMDKASCRAVYGVKASNKVECESKNYLLANAKDNWQVESEILDNQRVDRKTGELVTKEVLPASC